MAAARTGIDPGPVKRPRGLLGRLVSGMRPTRGPHIARVFHVDPPVGHPDHGTYQPYWVAMCDQGDLFPDSCDSEQAAFERARGHCESVDPSVYRPLDPDYVAPPRGEAQWQMT